MTSAQGNSSGYPVRKDECPASQLSTGIDADGSFSHHQLSETPAGVFFDSIRLLENLPVKRKASFAKLVPGKRILEPGSTLTVEGDVFLHLFSIRKGRLSMWKGRSWDCHGDLKSEGKRIAEITPGEITGGGGAIICRGRASIDIPWPVTVIAESQCEVLELVVEDLRAALGDDFDAIMMQCFIVTSFNREPFFKTLTFKQKHRLARAAEIRDYVPGQDIEHDAHYAVVLKGGLGRKDEAAPNNVFEGGFNGNPRRQVGAVYSVSSVLGGWEQASLRAAGEKRAGLEVAPGKVCGNAVVGGPDGATLAVLTSIHLSIILGEAGLSDFQREDVQDIKDYILEMLLAKRIPLFHHLSESQCEDLAEKFIPRQFPSGASVIDQGDLGTTFFVVGQGELEVLIDDKKIRSLLKAAVFGERALIFEEPRTASVRVLSETAELWCLEKHCFAEFLTPAMQDYLQTRISLQDACVELKELRQLRIIGAGGFGTVSLVEHKPTGLRYALKRVRKKDGQVPAAVRRECDLLKTMDHPLILQMLASFETSESVYILTEFIAGGNLRVALSKMGALASSNAPFYGAGICLALEALHDRDIVFRDLKPENVMLDASGYVKLVDFGLAKHLDESGRTFSVVGTPQYVAPEVICRAGHGTESDLWSLGVLLYEFLCGSKPFGNSTRVPKEIYQEILHAELSFPDSCDRRGCNLLKGLLEKQPEFRLGCGCFEDVKDHDFFMLDSSSIFDKVISREAIAPYLGSEAKTRVALSELSDADKIISEAEPALHAEAHTIPWRRTATQTSLLKFEDP